MRYKKEKDTLVKTRCIVSPPPPSPPTLSLPSLLPSYTSDLIEAGCDEVGRGCLAGPVVAAAVILPKDFTHPLLNDSKQLTSALRTQLEKEIKQAALSYAVAEVDHQTIDRINILQASFLAMHRAIEQLTITPELLLIDGNRFHPYPFIPHQCVVKGDSIYYSIAAASVVAKTYRDRLMIRLAREFPQYGWDTNVGYPTVLHRSAIRQHGITPWHRRSFKLISKQGPVSQR